jgi:hypothetical protein
MLLLTAVPAQLDDILLVERSVDRAGRNVLARELRKTRMDLNAEEMTIKEFASFLGIAMGNKVNFLVSTREMDPEDLPTITMSVNKLNLLSMMGVIARQTDLRFVYVSGVVMIKPKDEVREQRSLVVYDIRAAVAPLRDFPGPILELRRDGDDYEPIEETETDKTISGFDIDTIQDLIRAHVAPESWDEDGNSMSSSSGSLIVRQTSRNHEALRKFLIKVGAIPAPTLTGRRAQRSRAADLRALRESLREAEKPTKKQAEKKPPTKR